MCRSAGDAPRGPRRLTLAAMTAVAALVVGAPSGRLEAQAASGQPAGFELSPGVERALYRLQESWLQWVGAFYSDHPDKASEAVESMLSTAHQVGMTRVVDLALGAAAQALRSAEDGNMARARWALEAAERLDPGRPEIAFARARVERREGSYFAMVRDDVAGLARLLRVPERRLFAANLVFWLVAVAMIAAAFFVLTQVAAKGSAVVADLEGWLAKRVPRGVARLVALALLLWPLALPSGLLWLLLLWSVLLWGYESPSERWVSVGAWLVVGLAPWIAANEIERVALEQSPPIRALSHLAAGRLYGGLFADLEVLDKALSGEPVALELEADVHRTLGQWEQARFLYRRVLEAEPTNASALINMGAFYFRKGDFALAIPYFERAAKGLPPSAAAYYNLSLSYSESYQFEESRDALAAAKAIDGDLVDRWLQVPNLERVLTFNGGLERSAEIRDRLRSEWLGSRAGEVETRRRLRAWSGIAALAAALVAFALHLLRRKRGYGQPVDWLGWRSGQVSRWVRALLPSLSQAELGEGGREVASVVALAVLGLSPFLFSFGVELTLGGGFPAELARGFAILVLALYVAVCVRRELRQVE